MVKQYSEVFKKQAVNMLSELNEKGQVKVKKTLVTNVRSLVKELKITPYSLYKWRDEIKPKKPKPEKVVKKKAKKERKVTPSIEKEEIKKEVISEDIIPSEVNMRIFSGRFVGYIASEMGIQNYSRMKLKEVQFRIGREYIKKSGKSLKEVS